MTTEPPEGLDVDLGLANGARVYDYLLGGAHNFAVDREHAQRLLAANPGQQAAARANRSFLRRVVRWCLDHGVDQFLDLGSGVPTVGNVHEIARRIRPAARVAYVDIDPIAVAHSTALLGSTDGVGVLRADLRDAGTVLSAPEVTATLDLRRPVALLAVASLHFVAGDAGPVLRRYRDHLAPGSVLAISHGSDDLDDAGHAARMRAAAQTFAATASPVTYRSRAELRALLGDFEIVGPGLVDVTDWPDPTDGDPAATWGVVAVKPG